MGRSNKRRKIAASSCDGYYYPVYKGWVSKQTPIFSTASAAVSFQLIQYKRDLFEHNSVQTLPWLDCVGSIHPCNFGNIESSLFHSSSKIEKTYFESVTFYKLKANVKVKSCLVQVVPQTFHCCKNTLKAKTDYHSSSTSIFKQNSFCIQDRSNQSISYSVNRKGISQKRDINNLISISHNANEKLRNIKYDTVESIVKKVISLQNDYIDKEIIVSVGAGSGVTELASSIVTLCLDINKRSIFTGLGQVKNQLSRNTMVYALLDYSIHLEELITMLKERNPGKIIRFLLQHLNPSMDKSNRSSLTLLFNCIKTLLKNGFINDVTFVYDSSAASNTWSKADIHSLFISKGDESNFNFTDEILVSSKCNNNVVHPLFGRTKRYGWASMRNYDEYSFSISYLNKY